MLAVCGTELFKAIGGMGGGSLPSDMEFKMVALKPFSQIITYTGLVLGFAYLGGAFFTGGACIDVSLLDDVSKIKISVEQVRKLLNI